MDGFSLKVERVPACYPAQVSIIGVHGSVLFDCGHYVQRDSVPTADTLCPQCHSGKYLLELETVPVIKDLKEKCMELFGFVSTHRTPENIDMFDRCLAQLLEEIDRAKEAGPIVKVADVTVLTPCNISTDIHEKETKKWSRWLHCKRCELF